MESLEQQVGELFLFGFEGTSPDASIRSFLSKKYVGGVIFFARNFVDAEHLARLTREVTEIAGRPLLVCVDQEGGSVLRVRRGGSLFPSAMGLGRLEPDRIREIASMCGKEMRACGMNLNLAPVLDIYDPINPGIGIRSFGETPAVVARAARAYITGIQSAGVAATVKHFPGIGVATKDTHLELPQITKRVSELEAHELAPFREAIALGVRAAMTSHCVYPAWDVRPATLSPRILTGVLRKELGFEGVMITDDMRMGAIAKGNDPARAALDAFAAGCDLILICRDANVQLSAYDLILSALRSGDVPMSRLAESVARIRKLRNWISSHTVSRETITELHRRHRDVLDSVSDEIVRVLRDKERLLPLRWGGASVGILFPNADIHTPVEERVTGEEPILAQMASNLGGAEVLRYDPREPDLDSPVLRQFLEKRRQLVFFSANAHLNPGQARLLDRASKTAGKLVLVALRNPYDEACVPNVGTVVSSVGFLPNALAAAVRRLFAN
jgi:beta-N-acetylhexosaminidase